MRYTLILFVVIGLPAAVYTQAGSPGRFRSDDPLVTDPPPLPVKSAKPRKVSDVYDVFLNTFGHPAEQQPRAGQPIRARGVNTLGEVTDTAWYVGRHYFHPMSVDEQVRGPGNAMTPAEGTWTVVSAKNEGITPGFTIRDSKGELYVMKFDPLRNPEIASAADVISSKIFYALGYHVPENYIVYFDRSRLKLGEDTRFTDRTGRRRKMTDQDLADILVKVPRDEQKRYRAIASRYLIGRPVGPRRYHGMRRDDPNDTIPHEHRRDLRGFRVFCAWLDHDDSRAINSLDMIVEEGGTPFIKHYLVDFGSTLGSATSGPNSPRSGFEELFSGRPSAIQFFTLGIYVPRWARAHYPHLPSVGRFEYELFDPEKWTPEYRNPAFRNMLPDDAFWAARQVMAFTDEQLAAIVRTGQYTDPRATEWITRCLIERRNKIGRSFLYGVLPLDRFTLQDGTLRFVDLGSADSKYQVAWSVFDNTRGTHTSIDGEGFRVPRTNEPYLVAEIAGEDPKKTVLVYLRRKSDAWEVVGIERNW